MVLGEGVFEREVNMEGPWTFEDRLQAVEYIPVYTWIVPIDSRQESPIYAACCRKRREVWLSGCHQPLSRWF